MDFEYSKKTKMYMEQLTDFMNKHIYPNEHVFHEQLDAGPTRWQIPPIMEELKAKARERGLWNLFLPESERGAGLTNLEYAPLCEIMGRSHIAPEVFNCSAPDTGNMEVLERYGTEEHKKQWLQPLLEGKIRSAFAMTEPKVASSDATNIESSIVRDGDHYVINGAKMFITNGATADVFFLAARVEAGTDGKRHRGISMFLVERETPGFTVSRTLDKMGMRASDTAELSFQDMRVPAEHLLGREGVGFYEVMRVFQRERLVAGLHAVAMAARALEDTIAYVKDRQAFGGPLSDKQAVRHRLAEMATDIEAGRWLTYAACQRYQAGEDCVREISMVKLFTAEMVNRVAYGCVQLHGGYGYMREYAVERFARDARLMTIGGGTSEIMKDIIAKAIVR
jgi:acyl-CoA dehydrogenase